MFELSEPVPIFFSGLFCGYIGFCRCVHPFVVCSSTRVVLYGMQVPPGTTSLFLADNELCAAPVQIFVQSLISLDLSQNLLTTVPFWLLPLRNLTTLSLQVLFSSKHEAAH
jgi:hypothetical protein